MQTTKSKPIIQGQSESTAFLAFSKFNQNNIIEIKDILDKLGKGAKYEELSDDEQSLLKMHLANKIFDEAQDEKTRSTKLVYNPDKFKIFYEGFVNLFKERSAKMLGLKPEEASKLNYENLSQIVGEMKQTYFDTNSTSYGKIADLIQIWA